MKITDKEVFFDTTQRLDLTAKQSKLLATHYDYLSLPHSKNMFYSKVIGKDFTDKLTSIDRITPDDFEKAFQDFQDKSKFIQMVCIHKNLCKKLDTIK